MVQLVVTATQSSTRDVCAGRGIQFLAFAKKMARLGEAGRIEQEEIKFLGGQLLTCFPRSAGESRALRPRIVPSSLGYTTYSTGRAGCQALFSTLPKICGARFIGRMARFDRSLANLLFCQVHASGLRLECQTFN